MMASRSATSLFRVAAASRAPIRSFSSTVAAALPNSTAARQNPSQPQESDSTSALDYKLAHKLRKLPPLPSLEPPSLDAPQAVSNILYNTPPPSKAPFKRHTLNCLVQNEPGVLSRVAGTLAARGFNIDSLVVCGTEIRDLSRMCIVLRGQDGVIEQARRQLEDLVPVWAVLDYTNTKVIERELMLVKVSILGPEYFEESQQASNNPAGTPELIAERETDSSKPATPPSTPAPLTPTEALRVKSDNMRSVIAFAEQFRGRVVDVSSTSVIVEMSGKSSRCDAFLKLVRPFGILECARSGTMVLPRSPIPSSYAGAEDLTEEEVEAVDAGALPPG
ncbi:Acetolactate synthase, small subunit, C-terminal [Kalmanozyma brasiliensis GHG001]|uniref:Acetolactate synthase, small subunit n=1 Tax=Kalmanozyma brasiliensis (strain GHG001) TaxID=1365824 RepID=V5F1G2_KALBG|nr:Acetolactate synthase, small subunit, C-terminal [Kalmanozyma brasiliensis GHG001]EST09129.1 Acetolactate synthase, small subunit, C-terminal [Kalmanozyma brasiliensis GHG001]